MYDQFGLKLNVMIASGKTPVKNTKMQHLMTFLSPPQKLNPNFSPFANFWQSVKSSIPIFGNRRKAASQFLAICQFFADCQFFAVCQFLGRVNGQALNLLSLSQY